MGTEVDMRHPAEQAIRLGRPIQIYPIFETALRHQLGLEVDAHLDHIAKLWSDFSAVAADNPNAWIRQKKAPKTFAHHQPPIAPSLSPYPKFMNSNNNVDQGAALILCSQAKALAWVSQRKNGYTLGQGTDAHDHYFVSNRDNLYSSPAIRLAGNRCLELAGVSVGDLDRVDVYSCFQSPCRLLRANSG